MMGLSAFELWRERGQRWWGYVRRAAPFGAGMVAAFGALLLYDYLYPPPLPLTTRDVNESIVEAMASATAASISAWESCCGR